MEQKKKVPNKDKRIYLCIMILLGVLIAMQMRATITARIAAETEEEKRIQEYRETQKVLEEKLLKLQTELSTMKTQYDTKLEDLRMKSEDWYQLYIQTSEQIEANKILAALTAVSGPGIDIGLDDSILINTIVHDIYLVATVNVLRAAGAQAIEINGERILPTTEMTCLGHSIRINNKKIFAPYHIKAIGDPEVLLHAFTESPIYRTMRNQALVIDPVKKEKLVISRYSGNYQTMLSYLTDVTP